MQFFFGIAKLEGYGNIQWARVPQTPTILNWSSISFSILNVTRFIYLLLISRDLKWLFLKICSVLYMFVGERICWLFILLQPASNILTSLNFNAIAMNKQLSGYLYFEDYSVQSFFEHRSFIKKKKYVPIALLLLPCVWPHKGEFSYVHNVLSFYLALFAWWNISSRLD